MIVPRPAMRAGSNDFVTAATAITFTSYIRRHASRSASATGSNPNAPPALFTSSWSSEPTASVSVATSSADVTSHCTARPSISLASASMRSSRRAAQITSKPSRARYRADAAPIPLLAPVTTARGRSLEVIPRVSQRRSGTGPTVSGPAGPYRLPRGGLRRYDGTPPRRAHHTGQRHQADRQETAEHAERLPVRVDQRLSTERLYRHGQHHAGVREGSYSDE